ARAGKNDVEGLEEVELPEHERNLIRSGPRQNETHRCELSDNRLDRDTPSLHLRQRSRETELQGLGLPVEPQLHAERIGQDADGRSAINQRQTGHLVRWGTQDNGKLGHEVEPRVGWVLLPVLELLDQAHDCFPCSSRSAASWAAAPGAASGV